MSLKVYNSLSKRKEPFHPISADCVKLFVCGPTVYDFVHLGHARTYTAFDIIARYLRFLGFNVRCLMNITDVADRVIQRAKQQKKDPLELARRYERDFLYDMHALGITIVERCERASEHIPEIIRQIGGLVNKGVAYETKTGVYFEVKKFRKFGQLSGQNREELGLRRLELCSSKKNPEDFSLWRKHEKGLSWDSPWGHGRPGWHVEDTAISMKNFGETYDIHGGASELIFPHHEAEIAQAEALTGKAPFVHFWLHTGLLSIKGRKMSKSLRNVILIRDALKEYTASELRYYFTSVHYRHPIVMSDMGLRRARRELKSLESNFENFLAAPTTADSNSALRLKRLMLAAETRFRRHMDNDFDTTKALKTLLMVSEKLSRFAKATVGVDQQSKADVEKRFRRMADVLGVLAT